MNITAPSTTEELDRGSASDPCPSPVAFSAQGRSRRLTLIKNATANLARGGVAGLITLLLPPFLVRAMPVESYGAWVLILQISAYVAYLDFGIQTAVGRYVAHANEQRDEALRDQIVTTSFALLVVAGTLGLLLLGLLAWQMPHMFHSLPVAFYFQARISLLLVGGSLAIGLPASAFSGVFIGLQRFEVPAAIIAGGKLLNAVLLIVAVKIGGSMTVMAAFAAAANLTAAIAQYMAFRRLNTGVRMSPPLISKSAAREILGYCAGISVMMFGMLLVSGLDTTLVGIFRFRTVAFYSVAATLVTFVAGLQSMIFNVLMPEAAVMDARGDAKPLGEMLLAMTRLGMFLLLLIGLPLIIGAKTILTLWVGPAYAQQTVPLLQILAAANIIRLSAVPYTVLLMGTGQQRLAIISPLIEGFSNLFISIVAGFFLGAIVVALGTLIGSVIAVIGGICLSMPRTNRILVSQVSYLTDGLLRPLACSIPLVLVALLPWVGVHIPAWDTVPAFSGAVLTTLLIVWRWGLLPAERVRLVSYQHSAG